MTHCRLEAKYHLNINNTTIYNTKHFCIWTNQFCEPVKSINWKDSIQKNNFLRAPLEWISNYGNSLKNAVSILENNYMFSSHFQKYLE